MHTIVQMGMLQLRWALAAGDHGIFSMSACQANLGLEATFRPGTRKQQIFRNTLRAYERGCGPCHLTLLSLTLDACSKNLPPSSPPPPGMEVGEGNLRKGWFVYSYLLEPESRKLSLAQGELREPRNKASSPLLGSQVPPLTPCSP